MKNRNDLRLLLEAGSLEFLKVDFLCPLLKELHWNQHVLVRTDRFKKLTRSFLLRTITTSVVLNAFLDS